MLVKVTNPENGEIFEYYLDDKLHKQLEEKVKSALKERDEDYVVIVDGGERMGKSVFSMQLARYIDPTFNLDRVCFTPDDFRKQIINAKKFQAIIFDEAYRGMSAKGTLTEVNRILISMMMEIGQKNLFIIIVLPSFYLIERYMAQFRSKGLFHVFKRKRQKGYWRYFNMKKKSILYNMGKKSFGYGFVRTGMKGRFYNHYVVDEEEYRKKKDISLKTGYKTTRQEKYKEQRDKMLLIIRKELKLKIKEIEILLKKYNIPMKWSAIQFVLKEIAKKEGIDISLKDEKDENELDDREKKEDSEENEENEP